MSFSSLVRRLAARATVPPSAAITDVRHGKYATIGLSLPPFRVRPDEEVIFRPTISTALAKEVRRRRGKYLELTICDSQTHRSVTRFDDSLGRSKIHDRSVLPELAKLLQTVEVLI